MGLALIVACFLVHADPAPPKNPGHSHFGETFNEGPRQAARLMGGQGKISFAATSKSDDAKKFVDQGIGQLHGFLYREAERSFRQAATLDPDCAIAYWGMAMANINNRDRANEFIKEASKRKDKVSPRERGYIESFEKFFINKAASRSQYTTLIRDLENLVHMYPEDIEAKSFLAVTLWFANSQVPISSTQSADAFVQQIYAKEPLHPTHHYSIHLWDSDGRAERALHSAAACGDSAPGIAHMWHMPGHIYSKLKRYPESAWQFEASARVDHANMTRDRNMPYEIHNYAHNNEWMCRDLLKQGRVNEAMAAARDLSSLPRHPKLNDVAETTSAAGYGRRRLREALIASERWSDLLRECESGNLQPEGKLNEKLESLVALGSAAFSLGEVSKGDDAIARLEKLLEDVREADKKKQLEDEQKKKAEAAKKKSEPKKTPAKSTNETSKKPAETKSSSPKSVSSGRATTIESAIQELKAWKSASRGDFASAVKQSEKAKFLSKGKLAQWKAAAGDAKGAEEMARKFASDHQNEVFPAVSLISVLSTVGKTDEAASEFEKLSLLAGRADLGSPALGHLEPLLSMLELRGDWRTPTAMPADFGKRPELKSLGPLHFETWTVDSWTLPSVTGERFSLEDELKNNRAVLVLFYLGSGCVHCVEQLKAFAPMAKTFADRGIKIVAVSTEDMDAAKASLSVLDAGKTFAIPIVADPTFTLFKKYGVYDDFEKMPLHGTFLLDPNRRVLWRDISFEPFSDAKFLLDESRRLLQPKRNPDSAIGG